MADSVAPSVAESVAGSMADTDVDTVVDPVVDPVAKPEVDPMSLPFKMPFPTRHYYEDNNPYRLQMPTSLMPRAKFNASGKAAIINVNSHRILAYPKNTIYQYDVSTFSTFSRSHTLTRLQISIGTGAEKRGLIKGVWESKSVKSVIGPGFIFDGNKIGW